MAFLTFSNVTKQYGTRRALANLTCGAEAGRITGLLGPNGSGKTTMLKLAAGLLQPTDGEVRIGGLVPGTQTKACTAYLPDRVSLPQHFRAADAVALFRDFYEDFDAAKASEMLRTLGIEPGQRISAMSKGMQEKTQLCLTMARNAKLFLLDEPLGGVDPATRDYILSTIIRGYNEDAALVISTHIIGDVERILDDVLFLQNGGVTVADSAEHLRETRGKSVDGIFREVFSCLQN